MTAPLPSKAAAMNGRFCLLSTLIFFVVAGPTVADSASPESLREFLTKNCSDCHSGPDAEAGLNLESLPAEPADHEALKRWIRIFDRVHAGEMPPSEWGTVSASDQQKFLEDTKSWLENFQRGQWAEQGRVRGRRLTNLQLERSLHDLLGIDIPLASQMPEEPRNSLFTTDADSQPMSHFQLQQHLTIVDLALEEAFSRAFTKQSLLSRDLTAQQIARTNPRRRTREPEIIDELAVTWSSRLIFYGRLPATTAPQDGWYRFRIRAKAVNAPADRGVWCTVKSGRCVSSAPLLSWLGAFEVTDQMQEWTFTGWMTRGDMLEVRPGDGTLKMGRFAGGQVGTGEGGPQNLSGIAIRNIVMQQVHEGPDSAGIRELLFGQLQPEKVVADWRQAKLISASPQQDLRNKLLQFASRAFRHPVPDDQIADYLQLADDHLRQTGSLVDALRVGFRSLLCSPRFLYFTAAPGPLDSWAVASRLSYFLWNRPPDQQLVQLATQDRLQDQAVVLQQLDRMLQGTGGDRFISDFSDQWLDLRDIDFTTPDRRLYPNFDVIVQHSMVAETKTFLQRMLHENHSVARLINSDETWLNERLARFYGIPGVRGDQLQPVSLREHSVPGGLVTQGAIMKVTANGTTTSPVLRGVWVSERLLGREIPPPPTSVPAIEPDIRGATTIREMLEKHKSDSACASCHRSIDPPGFALENFDASGRWRTRYPAGSRAGQGAVIDTSYQTVSGEQFDTLQEFQQLICRHPDRIAAGLCRKLIEYGTGMEVTFAERDEIARMVNAAADEDYGFRTLVQKVVSSSIFLNR